MSDVEQISVSETDQVSVSDNGIRTPERLPGIEGRVGPDEGVGMDEIQAPRPLGGYQPLDRSQAFEAMKKANPHLEQYDNVIQYMVDALIAGVSQEDIGATASAMLKEEMLKGMTDGTGTTNKGVDPNFEKFVVQELYKQFQVTAEDGSTRNIQLVRTCKSPEIIIAPEFLTADECDALVEESKRQTWCNSHTRKLVVRTKDGSLLDIYAPFDYKTPDTQLNTDIRVSKTAILSYKEGTLVNRICSRISQVFSVPFEHMERPNISKYSNGDYFNNHIDGSFRLATIKIFLTDLEDAGNYEVEYSNLGFKVRPKRGLAMFHFNITSESRETALKDASKAVPLLPLLKNINNKRTDGVEEAGPCNQDLMIADFFVSLVEQPK